MWKLTIKQTRTFLTCDGTFEGIASFSNNDLGKLYEVLMLLETSKPDGKTTYTIEKVGEEE